MNTERVSFINKEGLELSGRLELPLNQDPHNFAIFAHCFTCSKNLLAVRNISRTLTDSGFGVLRFDFTGLGESAGEFSESNFSVNVEDLVSAASFLKENYISPSLLIGHSLGGAAVIFAAGEIQGIKAVATIGAPSNPDHVKHLFKNSIDQIKDTGEARVNLGGRDFTIKKQFVDDLNRHSASSVLKSLDAALLIMHSPQDMTVEIKNAEELYKAARHPKSFVSLDGADHLLSNKSDSLYVGDVIAGWAQRYIDIPEEESLSTSEQVVASLDADDGFTTKIKAGNHHLVADEPTSFGGNDYGPSPYELVSAGLSACTVMTVQMYVKRKGWPLENIEVHVSHDKVHAEDCKKTDDKPQKIDQFKRLIKLEGDLQKDQKDRILEIANKCPVHKTLEGKIQIKTELSS